MDRGWHLPGRRKVVVDVEPFLNIIDQMRISMPGEVKEARELQQERDKYLTQAREEARRLIAEAREDVARQLSEHAIRRNAETQAEVALRRAQQEAARVRSGADQYAEDTLRELDERVARLQDEIRNGLSVLRARRGEHGAQTSPAVAAAPDGAMAADGQPASEGEIEREAGGLSLAVGADPSPSR